MFKKICIALFSGSLLFAAPNTNNIKRIIKENNKIIVVIRENGKDKRVELSSKDLEKLTNKSKKNSSKKVAKKSKKSNSKKIATKSTKDKKVANKKNSSKSNKKVVSNKSSKNKKVATKNAKPHKHTVASGDTLFSIARKYKVSITDLVKLNKLKSSTLIVPGQVINIPSSGYFEAAKKAVESNDKTVYKVKKGDTLYSIARLYNMKPDTIRKMNNLKKNPKLKPGMELNVLGKPVLIAKRKKPTKYVVKRGDTIWRIAREHGLTIAQLRLLNPKLRRGLRKGDVLKVSKKEAIKLAKSLKKRRRKRLSGALAKYQRSYSSSSGNRVVRYAKRWLGSRYVWGASRPGAFDCSGFTSYVMRHAKGRAIPRVSRRQAYYGRYVSRRNLRPGDLIFFDTSRRRRGYVNHVGIYIGNHLFIHASSAKHRVVITSLNKPFYRSRFMWGRRIN